MSYVLQLIGTASGEPTGHDGQYLVEYRPPPMNARGEYGPVGVLRTTRLIANAKRFASQAEAFALYTRTNGLRPDGKPNRPLCAYTVQIFAAPQNSRGVE